MKPIIIIPARLGSERLKAKPLLKMDGKSMIRHTVERVLQGGIEPVAVASDSELVLDEIRDLRGVIPVMTSPDHSCGTERVLEAYQILSKELGEFDWIINVQGDEPFIEPELIRALPAELEKRKDLAEFLTTVADLKEFEKGDRNVAKVVMDLKQNALIFTRDDLQCAYKHTSIYIYTPAFLDTFCNLPASPLEKAYSLEQMRALDNGFNLNCIPLPYDAISINTVEDLEKAKVKDYRFFEEK
ncbi:MAG: 3-deoxy-manno-octulosonate cytidylyltransferase [Proteobacteria bacterium]|nr:3-deoxy-manno-octulosonate cytidylyltransferase [Pseudomonadota bacterium]